MIKICNAAPKQATTNKGMKRSAFMGWPVIA
jgi:hypothetical protein